MSFPASIDVTQNLSLTDYVVAVRRWLRFIIIFAAGLTAVSAAVVFNLAPKYSASAIISADSRRSKMVELQSVASDAPESSAVRTQIEVIRGEAEIIQSPQLLEAVVKRLDLVNNPEFKPLLDNRSWGSRAVDLVPDYVWTQLGLREHLVDALSPNQTPLAAATNQLQKLLAVAQDGKSYIIKLTVTTSNPDLSATIANGIAAAYLDQQRQANVQAIEQANEWLSKYLEQLRAGVVKADLAVEQFRKAHKLTESKGMTVDTQQLNELNTALAVATADRAQKEAALRSWQHAGQHLDEGPGVTESPLIHQLSEQRAELLRRQAQLETTFGERYPAVKGIRTEINALNKTIHLEIARIVENVSKDVRAARAKEETLRGWVRQSQKAAAANDQSQVQLRALERDADANRTLYNNLLQRSKQASVELKTQEPSSRIASEAKPPLIPSFPNKKLMIAGSGIASVLIGLFLALFFEATADGFRSADQLSKVGGIKALGLVPRTSKRDRPEDEVIKRPTSIYTECIHSVAAMLGISDSSSPLRTVLVTSAAPGEGKSTFAISLTRALASTGRRCLLIDCDFRRSQLAKMLGKPNAALDATQWAVIGSKGLESRVVKDLSGVDYLANRADERSAHSLVSSEQLREFIACMRERYDLIVIDAPPLLAMSDALHLSQFADAVILMVRWGATPRKLVANALSVLRQRSCVVAGAVLSQVDFKKQAKYRYGDIGQYAQHFGKYYGSASRARMRLNAAADS